MMHVRTATHSLLAILALCLQQFSSLAFLMPHPPAWIRASHMHCYGIQLKSSIEEMTDGFVVFQNPHSNEICAVVGSDAEQAIQQEGWQQIEMPIVSSAKEVRSLLKEGAGKEKDEDALDFSIEEVVNPKLDAELQKALVEFYKSEEERVAALTSLVKSGASIERTMVMMRAASDLRYGARNLKVLLDLGGSVHNRDAYGSTPLHVAAVFCNADVAGILLQQGADIEATDNDGLTPKMVLAQTVERNQEMEMEIGTAMPFEERKQQDRIQTLFDARR
jgi:hypothetical protein